MDKPKKPKNTKFIEGTDEIPKDIEWTMKPTYRILKEEGILKVKKDK